MAAGRVRIENADDFVPDGAGAPSMRVRIDNADAFVPDQAPSRGSVMRSGIAPGTTFAVENPVTQGEAAMRGAGQGAFLGFADELAAGATALMESRDLSTLPTGYRRERSYQRGRDDEAQESFPKTYLAGEFAGGAATAFIPGAGIARAPSVGRAIMTGAKLGAGAGVGGSEADLTRGEVGNAVIDAGIGAATGAVAGGALHGAGRLIGGAPTRARGYAGDQLGRAQAEGPEALARAARTYGPLTEESAPEIVRAIRTPGGGAASADRELAARAVNELREGVPNAKKMKIFGQEGKNDVGIRRTLSEDLELRQALEARDSDAALAVVRDRIATSGAAKDRAIEVAADATDGVPVQKVIRGLEAARKEFDKTTATKPMADKLFRQMKTLYEQYAETNGGKIPLQQARTEYRAWQDISHETRRAVGPLTEQQEVSEVMYQTMREALHSEIEHAVPGPLAAIVKTEDARMSNYFRIKDALVEKSTREHADAPTGVQLFRSIRDAVHDAGQGVVRATEAQAARGVARVQASPLGPAISRGYGFAEQAGTVASANDPKTRSAYGPYDEEPPFEQALANAARGGADPNTLLQKALAAGIPEDRAIAAINRGRRH